MIMQRLLSVRVVQPWLLVLTAGLMVGCGLTRQLEPVSVLAPEVALSTEQSLPVVEWAVQVRRPVSDRMRDSERLFVRVGGSRLQAYPGAVWLDQAPDMLQTLTIQMLEDSGRFQGVGRAGGLRSRFALDTEMRRFDAVDDGGQNLSVELVMQVRLISQRSGQVVASQTFEFAERSTGKQLDPLIAAFERSLVAYFGQLLPWVLEQGQLAVEQETDRQRTRPRNRDIAESRG